jgi:tetratricopeptide (TPR) repeat protein
MPALPALFSVCSVSSLLSILLYPIEVRSILHNACLAIVLLIQAPSGSYEQALSLIQQQQFEPGIAILRKILEVSPNEIKAHNLLGIALTITGKAEEANRHFEQAIALNPKFAPAIKNLAINEMKLNQIEKARARFMQLIEFGSEDPVVHLALAEIHFQNKQYADAMKYYERSRDLGFKDPRTVLNYATSCVEANQLEKANLVLDKFPAEADASSHFEAGALFVRLEKYDRAAGQFELARKAGYHDSYQVTFNITLAHLKSRNYRSAIDVAQEFLSRDSKRAELYNLLAQAYEGNGQTVEAYNALRAATNLEPKDVSNYLDLATLCVDHANYDLGLEIVGIGINNIPQSDRLYFQRGTLLAMKGQSSEAARDFDTASKLSPQNNLPYIARGLVLLELGQATQAIELLRQRVKESSDDHLVLYVIGEAINRIGPASGSAEEKEAIQALEKSVLINPAFAASRATLGKLLLRRGEVDRAIKELEKALELDPEETSSLYQLAVAYRKKGNQARAKELFARVDQAKTESREQFMKRTLLRLVRQGSQ